MLKHSSFLKKYESRIDHIQAIKHRGLVSKVHAGILEGQGPWAVIGELCEIRNRNNESYWGEVISLDQEKVRVMSYNDIDDVGIGSEIIAQGQSLEIPVSDALLGRVLNAMGKPIDNKGGIGAEDFISVMRKPPHPLERTVINKGITTGVKAIDSFIPLGKGQRVGIFAGSGVGKSTLLGMIARNTNADINVIVLIGERGREVREFIENDLGPEGLARSVLVVATSDDPALARLKASFTAASIAEYFRDQGKDVMLLFDSVTRLALAQREIGLAAGEPPTTRGFPPSVFSLLPRIMERSGTGKIGSITGLYTVLVDGDDFDEPISDAVRGILDGHIMLNRHLAQKAHYPAIDVLASISRLEKAVLTKEEKQLLGIVRRYLATYKEKEDLINIGAYETGSNEELDQAINLSRVLMNFLQQNVDENYTREETWDQLIQLTNSALVS